MNGKKATKLSQKLKNSFWLCNMCGLVLILYFAIFILSILIQWEICALKTSNKRTRKKPKTIFFFSLFIECVWMHFSNFLIFPFSLL